jgi:hypothetical protein
MTHNNDKQGRKTLEPIKEARTKWSMERLVAFDIESHDWTDPVAIGWVTPETEEGHYVERVANGDNDIISEFVDEILRRKWRNHRFVAHYGGNYDFGFIIEELCKRDVNFEVLTKGKSSDIFFVRIEDDVGKPRYLQDSFALMQMGLKSLTESFCSDFQKLEPDGWSVGDIPSSSKIQDWEYLDSMREYLERDCRSLRKVLESFTSVITELSDGRVGPQLTSASTTMSMYRTSFMEREDTPNMETSNKEDLVVNPETEIRKSYFGGRTEVFKMEAPKSEGPYYHYDVNSLYPYCYSQFKLPTGEVRRFQTQPMIDRMIEDRNMGGVLHIQGEVPKDTHIPVLPVRTEPQGRSQEKVIFPTGKIEGWYTVREVNYAKSVGALENVTITDSYLSTMTYPFKKYGTKLYELKQSIDSEKNPAMYIVIKLLLNSFYGKFGMDREQTSVVKLPKENFRECMLSGDYRAFGDNNQAQLLNRGIVEKDEVSKSGYILPRIATGITAQARIEMHKWIMKCKEKGGSVWYCDTDSVVTDIKLEEGHDLGEMDLEGIISEGYFLRPKTYAEKYEDGDFLVKGKGMRDIEKYVTFDTFKNAYQKQDTQLIHSKWSGTQGVMLGLKQNPENIMKVKDYKRSLKGFDDKREHDMDTNTSVPIHLEG